MHFVLPPASPFLGVAITYNGISRYASRFCFSLTHCSYYSTTTCHPFLSPTVASDAGQHFTF